MIDQYFKTDLNEFLPLNLSVTILLVITFIPDNLSSGVIRLILPITLHLTMNGFSSCHELWYIFTLECNSEEKEV